MPIPWGDHLDLARVVEATGELDVGAAAVVMGGALHVLQRDLTLGLHVDDLALIDHNRVDEVQEQRPQLLMGRIA